MTEIREINEYNNSVIIFFLLLVQNKNYNSNIIIMITPIIDVLVENIDIENKRCYINSYFLTISRLLKLENTFLDSNKMMNIEGWQSIIMSLNNMLQHETYLME